MKKIGSYLGVIGFMVVLGAKMFAGVANEPAVSIDKKETTSSREEVMDGIAAIVDGKIITVAEIRQDIAPLVRQIQAESKTVEDFKQKIKTLYLEHLQHKIDHILVVNAFYKEGHKINKAGIEDQFDENLKLDFGGNRSQFLKYLQSQGKTVRQYRKELEEFLIVMGMREKKRRSQVEVSPEKIKEYYNENKNKFFNEESIHIRQITLVGKKNDKGELNVDNLQVVIDALKKGSLFEDVAKKYSQDSKQNQGGDWGWVSKTDLVPEIGKAAFALKPKEYCQPIFVGNNTFIIYLIEKKDAGFQPLDQVRDKIEKVLNDQISKKNYEQWVDELRKNAFIKYIDNEIM